MDERLKTCTKCKTEQPITEFNRDRAQKSGLRPDCKACNKARARKWQVANRDRYNAYQRVYQRARVQRHRIEIIEILGGMCRACGLTDRRVLQVDHVNDDGAAHRQAVSTGHMYYDDIIRRIKAGDNSFQVLCANCHFIKSQARRTVG